MPERVTDEDLELLGELGVDTAPAGPAGASPGNSESSRDSRRSSGSWRNTDGRPQHGENRDIFERLYAVRLDRMRESAECREVLKDLDSRGLLGAGDDASANVAEDEPSDEELLASLGSRRPPENDVTQLVHVRSREEIKAAEEIAQRNSVQGFRRIQTDLRKSAARVGDGCSGRR